MPAGRRPVLLAVLALLGEPGGAHGEVSLRLGDPALQALSGRLAPTLEANRKELRGRTGLVRGFGAGTAYPQIWLRDSATLLPLARWLYPRDYLDSWLVEHLAHQRADGALRDWIAAGWPSAFRRDAPAVEAVYREGPVVISADRNTTEADQEASAVEAAHQVFRITADRAWLRGAVAGRPLVDRLDAALAFVLRARFSRRYGLVTSAFTADWGDVSPVYGDQRAIYLDNRTPVVAGLYTNALFCQAARDLAALLGAAGRPGRARFWAEQARRVAAAVGRQLWQDERGFYRLHLVESAPVGWAAPDDADVFALGGNAVAVLAGLADARQAARIFAVAEERRQRFGLSTVAGTLLPPYPRGVFRHPILREPYTYQNGGQWDWFGGRLVQAEFERGHAGLARRQLGQIAGRAVRSGGMREWATRDGAGRGSAAYAGSAGALGAALIAGLFGVDLHDGRLDLTVRLAEEEGELRLAEPATGTAVACSSDYDARSGTLRVRYSSGARRPGILRVRLPERMRPASTTLDGRPVPGRVEAVGEDAYVRLTTSAGDHELRVQLTPGR
ncbi:MAG: hypothetical protein DMF80_08205 [Acidobacteria bacterium]|nr:MAG: hypothetical protein DMF80_08205 [Acidobacteriota bacterium]